MAFHARTRRGGGEPQLSVERLWEILAELDAEDDEHPSVSLTHESEWCLGAYRGGLLVWENLEGDEPRHMDGVPRERVFEMWVRLSQGRLAEIEQEPWLPG